MGSVQPPVKVYLDLDRLTVAAALPGFGPDDIDIEVTADGRLVLDGRLSDAPGSGQLKSADKHVFLDEWMPAPFHRELALPRPVDAQSGTVTFGNGVLVVSMPVSDAMRSARLRLWDPLESTCRHASLSIL